ncbi:MAG: helix-turn-helix transcriptional regulator [Pelagimonas sp.]|uniref:helix-turn-helix transcriptional regulator n=1 Tax=Pelagimonas sp. TaxID=2073170 RepID=UPI003D6B00A4
MEHSKLTQFRGSEATLPAPLFSFLQQLGDVQSSDQVWANFTHLCKAFGLPSVTYIQRGCPLDNVEDTPDDTCGWHILSTGDAGLVAPLLSLPLLSPLLQGAGASLSLTPELLHMRAPRASDAEHELQSEILAQLGMPIGLAIPVLSGDAQDAAVMLIGFQRSAAECNCILERFGCGLHLAAMASHARYNALYKQEFIARVQLTEKQAELIALVGTGLLDKQIAYQLGISFSAVRQRLAAVQHKTGARNRAHLSAIAMRIGLTPDPLMTTAGIAAE